MDQQAPKGEYTPNIYPIMYWAILYGIIAAFALLIVNLLAGFIAVIWFPVFLAGVVWGGYRKYKQDKAAWMQSAPFDPAQGKPKSPVEEFKDAAKDIAQASREMIARQAQENAAVAQTAQAEVTQEKVLEEIEEASAAAEAPADTAEEPPRPPTSPLQPLV